MALGEIVIDFYGHMLTACLLGFGVGLHAFDDSIHASLASDTTITLISFVVSHSELVPSST